MATRRQQYNELTIPIFTQWEKVDSVNRILAQLELGQFYDGALLVDQMLRDDRVLGVLNVRIAALLGSEMHMEPYEHDDGRRKPTSQAAADDAQESWTAMMSPAAAWQLKAWGLMLGVGVAQRVYQRTAKQWTYTARVWHPFSLRWDIANHVYQLYHADGFVEIEPGDPDWCLYTPFGFENAGRRGLVRALAMPWLARQWCFRDRSRHSERHGMPFLKGITPLSADAKDKVEYKRRLSALGSETVVISPQGTDGKWDVELVESASDGFKTFEALIDHCDKAIAITLLGQAQSTQGQPGLGSQEKAGDSVRGDVLKGDARAFGEFGKEFLEPWANANYDMAAPTPCFEVDPPEDGLKKAQELSTIADAIVKLEPFGLDGRSVLEEGGWPMLTEAQMQAKKAQAVKDAQNAVGTKPGENPAEDKNEKPSDETPAKQTADANGENP